MTRKLAVVGAAMGILLTASVASAQRLDFGQKGEFVFSADRLVPVLSFTENKITNNNVNPSQSTSTTGSSISLLYGDNSIVSGTGLAAGNPTFYTSPRVGFDYVFLPNWTIGGDLFVFFTLGGSNTGSQGGNSASSDTPSGNAFGVAPRVGYVFDINALLSFWLRGGFSFYHAGTSEQDANCNNGSDTTSLNVFGLDLDPQLVISPTPHFAFLAGPAIDFGFAGGYGTSRPGGPNGCSSTISTSDGYSSHLIGLTGGMMGWF